ncbi:hypothetical protein PIB30_077386 [Stylosanthes scabra]|uniref:Uncharacterized protein n=1 Tax=Stylosanthes scabra TaxID=79078 RepID=A0ABU6VU12_9FABA|nr:hypothetical protein [Stylosanthes scabra]
MDNGEEEEVEDEEGEDGWLYELLAELANSDKSDDEEEVESKDEEEVEEEVESETEGEDEEQVSKGSDKGKTFFIATLFSEGKTMKEEMPVKCEDPGMCTLKVDNAKVQKKSPRRKTKGRVQDSPKGRIGNEKRSRNAPRQTEGKKKKIPSNPEKKKKKKKKEPDEDRTEKKRALKCLSFNGLLGKLKVLKDALHCNKSVDAHLVKKNSKWK